MSEKHQRALAELKSTSHFYDKYRDHRGAAVTRISASNAEAYDRVQEARTKLNELVEKHAKGASQSEESSQVENNSAEKSDARQKAEKRVQDLQARVDSLSKEAESSLRQLVDYGDELHQQEQIMTDMKDQVAIDANRPQPPKKRRRTNKETVEGGTYNVTSDEDEDEDEEGEDLVPELPADVLSPFEVFQKAKTDYAEHYASQTMRKR